MTDGKPDDVDDILESIRNAVTFGETTDDGAVTADAEATSPPEELELTDPIDEEPADGQAATAAPATTDTVLEALVMRSLEPMLRAWIDANLPEIVERATLAEIKRLTAG